MRLLKETLEIRANSEIEAKIKTTVIVQIIKSKRTSPLLLRGITSSGRR